MQLTVHDDAKSFLVATGALLRAAEAENSIIATPAWRMATAPRDDDGDAYFASVADGGTVVAAALFSRSSNLATTNGPPDIAVANLGTWLGRKHRAKPLLATGASTRARRTSFAFIFAISS